MPDDNPRNDRTERLREQIASKLREKAPARPAAGEGQAPRPEAPRPSRRETMPPQEEEVSALETAKQVLGARIALTGPKLTDLAVMCRQMATLIEVGIPLLRALKILGQRTHHPQLASGIREVANDVEQGAALSSALEKHPRLFPELIVNIVKIGEAGGVLEQSLRRLADIYERRAHIKRSVISAMFYPIAVICVATAVVIAIFAYAVPVFQQVYTQKEGVSLPDITLQVIAISEFIRHQWMWYIPLVIVVLFALIWFGRTPRGRWIYDRLSLKAPVMGPLITKISTARFTRTLSNLLSAGIPLIEALRSTARSSENVVLADALMKTRAEVEAGGDMEAALRQSRVVPPMVIDMMAIGDETGTLDVMLDRIADAYEDEVDAAVRGLTAIIEPLLIIFLGIVVLMLALAILLPYWNIGEIVG